MGGFRSQENTLQSFAHLRMYWFRSSDLGNITVTTRTYQPPSPLEAIFRFPFPVLVSSCSLEHTGKLAEFSAQVVEWTGVDQKEWHEGFSEDEVIGLALLIGWECWEGFDARDFLGSMFADWTYHVLYSYTLPSLQPSKSFSFDLILKFEGTNSSACWEPQPEVLHSIRSCLWKVPVEDPCAMAGQALSSRCHDHCSATAHCICMFVLSSPSPITNVPALEVHTFRTRLSAENQPLMPSLLSWDQCVNESSLIIKSEEQKTAPDRNKSRTTAVASCWGSHQRRLNWLPRSQQLGRGIWWWFDNADVFLFVFFQCLVLSMCFYLVS